MTKAKLAPAKDWRNRDLSTWNTTTFTEYLKARHTELFGIDYAPFGGTWRTEQGIIGSLIGTQSRTNPKPRTASNSDVKQFIDECFASYRPTSRFPGTSLGFCWTYRKDVWQRIKSENTEATRRNESRQGMPSLDELAGWL